MQGWRGDKQTKISDPSSLIRWDKSSSWCCDFDPHMLRGTFTIDTHVTEFSFQDRQNTKLWAGHNGGLTMHSQKAMFLSDRKDRVYKQWAMMLYGTYFRWPLCHVFLHNIHATHMSAFASGTVTWCLATRL